MDQDIGHVADATALEVTTTPEALMSAWNMSIQRLPKATKLTGERRRHAVSRLREEPALHIWRNAFVRLDASDFACGVAGGWRADFDFMLRPGSLIKVLEGKYDNRAGKIDAATARKLGPTYTPPSQWICKHEPRCGTRAQHQQYLDIEAMKATG